MILLDFNECSLSVFEYGGNAGNKLGIIHEGHNWMLKFPKSTKNMLNVQLSYTNSSVCEFVGSHV